MFSYSSVECSSGPFALSLFPSPGPFVMDAKYLGKKEIEKTMPL